MFTFFFCQQAVQNDDDDSDSTSNDGHSRPSSLLKRTKSEVRSSTTHGKYLFLLFLMTALLPICNLYLFSLKKARMKFDLTVFIYDCAPCFKIFYPKKRKSSKTLDN